MLRSLSLGISLLVLALGCASPVMNLDVETDGGEARAVGYIVLKNGSSGTEVKALQYLLRFRGYSIGVDGLFGSGTENVVKTFQRSAGLTADGIVGTNTWGKLVVTVQQGSSGDAVRAVQEVLKTKFRYSLTVDGIFGSGTRSAVINFQSSKGLSADGIVGPASWTQLLGVTIAAPANFWSNKGHWKYPLARRHSLDPWSGGRAFGASRDGGTRAHAGVDLIAPGGTTVYAMESGKVINYYYFYSGTYALEVRHADGTIARYGEIQKLSSIAVGQNVTRGQAIATVKTLQSGSSMLHLEVYQGTATGGLTNSSNTVYDFVPNRKYQRRRDLQDPMGVINLN